MLWMTDLRLRRVWVLVLELGVVVDATGATGWPVIVIEFVDIKVGIVICIELDVGQ